MIFVDILGLRNSKLYISKYERLSEM